ncbi:hypothetical protein ABPG74_020197 [Tetrahymena malaccensis]
MGQMEAKTRYEKRNDYGAYEDGIEIENPCNGNCNGMGYRKSYKRIGTDASKLQIFGNSATLGQTQVFEHIPDASCGIPQKDQKKNNQ